jgi:excisionase family DNA binding protein
MNPTIKSLFHEYLGVAGDDKATAAILTLADVLAPSPGTEIVPSPAADGRLLSVDEAGKRLNLSSRLVYKKCLTGELRPVQIGRRIYIPVVEVERYEARQ